MPPAVIAGIGAGAAAASAATGIAGAIKGPSGGDGRKSLPPEEEFAYIKNLGSILDNLNKDIDRTTSLESSLNKKNDIERQRISGLIPPSAAVEALRKENQNIAMLFGGNTEALLKNGLMTPQDLNDLATGGPKANAATEQQLKDSEYNLRTQLRRELGPGYETTEAGRRALDTFNNQAQQTREASGNNEIQRRLAFRTQGLNEAIAGRDTVSNALQGERYASLVGSQYISGLNQADYNAGLEGIKTRAGLGEEIQSAYSNLGNFDLSGRAKLGLESGLIGPGTIYDQTKVSGDLLRDYRNHAVGTMNRMPQRVFGRSGLTPAYGGFGYASG